MTMALERESLNTMPCELLEHIIESDLLIEDIRTLAQTNRRLRSLTQTLALRRLLVPNPEGMFAFCEFFESWPDLSLSVRSLQIGSDSGRFYILYPYWAYLVYGKWQYNSAFLSSNHKIPRFPNLHQYQCLEAPIYPDEFYRLRLPRSLTSLSITFMMDNTAILPDLDDFNALDSLRIHFLSSLSPATLESIALFDLEGITLGLPSSSLTTLIFHDTSHTVEYLLPSISLPNIRVCNFQLLGLFSDDAALDFIQRHPSLVEVNIGDIPCYSSRGHFDNVLKAAAGMNYEEGFSPTTLFTFLEPYSYDWNLLTLSRFAFARKRVPIAADIYDRPMYELTALALELQSSLIPFGAIFPSLQYLCLDYMRVVNQEVGDVYNDQEQEDQRSFVSELCFLADELAAQPALRRLTVRMDIPRYGGESPITRPILGDKPTLMERMHPIWHSSEPLLFGAGSQDDTVKLNALRLEIAGLLQITDMGSGNFTADQLMHAWQIRNRDTVSKAVLYLAERCPLLEVFEWYAGPRGEQRGPLWKWSIARGTNGAISMSDDLTWKGCTKGDPPPMEILVGQELAAHRKRHAQRHR